MTPEVSPLHHFVDNRFSGDHIGRDAVVATLLAISEITPRQLVEVEEILAAPGSSVVVARERLTVDGVDHVLRRVLRFRIRGERFTDCWLYDEEQALIDRAWAA